MQDLRCSESTPSQRLAAAARRERQQRFEQSAIARVHEVVELPVDKTERPVLPIVPVPPAPPESNPVEQWVERQKAIYKPWFSIVEEIHTDGKKKITITEIQQAICRYFNVSNIDLLSARRTVQIVRPRQVGYYLAKMLTVHSLPEIGRRFGGRDHTTALSGVRRIEQLRKTDEVLNNTVLSLAASLGGCLA